MVRVGAAEADEDGRVVRRAQHDAALVEVAVLHAGGVQRAQRVERVFPARGGRSVGAWGRGDGTGAHLKSMPHA